MDGADGQVVLCHAAGAEEQATHDEHEFDEVCWQHGHAFERVNRGFKKAFNAACKLGKNTKSKSIKAPIFSARGLIRILCH